VHIINETSAFRDITADKFTEVEGALVLNVGGVDDNSAQRLHARQIFRETTSAGSTAIATSPACRSGAVCCSTTPNSTRSTRRKCEPAWRQREKVRTTRVRPLIGRLSR
jgi:hypothetical protein